MTNTIIWGNSVGDRVSNLTGTITAETFSHSCAPELAGIATCTGSDPQFNVGKRASRPYYSLRGNSPCRNVGAKADWTEGAADLIGNPRVFGGRPDMGCYESLTGGFMLLVK